MQPSALKVLMISSDRRILEAGSAVETRMKEYGKLVSELHIVLLSDASHGLKDAMIGDNIWVYPTHSVAAPLRPWDARRVGNRVVIDRQFVRGAAVITADSIECGWAGIGIKHRFRLPLEMQLHTDPFSPYFTGFQNNVRKFFATSVLESADSIRVVSRAVGEEIAARFPEKKDAIVILPIYVDREKIEKAQIHFDLHARFGWRYSILCVGRLAPEKNFDMALDVMRRLKPYHSDLGLVIVGSGPEEAHLRAIAAKLGIESNTMFVGWQEDVASYYHSATLFLQTSRFEGYGLALVEAGLSGLPVVSTPVGIANDLTNGEDLIICPHNDPDFMFKTVYDLLSNDFKRGSLKISMKRALDETLLTKEVYLTQLQKNWQITAAHIPA